MLMTVKVHFMIHFSIFIKNSSVKTISYAVDLGVTGFLALILKLQSLPSTVNKSLATND